MRAQVEDEWEGRASETTAAAERFAFRGHAAHRLMSASTGRERAFHRPIDPSH